MHCDTVRPIGQAQHKRRYGPFSRRANSIDEIRDASPPVRDRTVRQQPRHLASQRNVNLIGQYWPKPWELHDDW